MKIAFDIGNVLCHVNLDPFYKCIYEKLSASPYGAVNHDMKAFVSKIEKFDYLGIQSFRQSLQNKYPFPCLHENDIDDIINSWNDCLEISIPMLNFLKNLKHDGVQVALLSNIGIDHASHLRENLKLFDFADHLHLSYEVGAMKPQKLFFQSFLYEHEDFSGCLYLDDRMENIISASKSRFTSIHFDLHNLTHNQPPSVLMKELQKIKDALYRGR